MSGHKNLTQDVLRTFVTDMTFESNVTPKILVRDPFGPVIESAVGRFVQPRVTFYSPQFGSQTITPWGAPRPSTFPILAGFVGVSLVVLTYYAWRGWTS